jgi:hypothetical protein
MTFAFWLWIEMRRIYSAENADCFWDLGAYQVCDSTVFLSIFSSMFLLMTQALVSRILVPGKSSFVNASVSGWLRRLCVSPLSAFCTKDFILACSCVRCRFAAWSRASDIALVVCFIRASRRRPTALCC